MGPEILLIMQTLSVISKGVEALSKKEVSEEDRNNIAADLHSNRAKLDDLVAAAKARQGE